MQKEKESSEETVEELPIEEFENDTQDYLKEYLEKFPDEEEIEEDKPIKKGGHERWL